MHKQAWSEDTSPLQRTFTHVMTPYLIILRKLDKSNNVELSVHFSDDVYLWACRMSRIGLGARDTNVYIQCGQRFFTVIENRSVLRFVIWYLTVSHACRARQDIQE